MKSPWTPSNVAVAQVSVRELPPKHSKLGSSPTAVDYTCPHAFASWTIQNWGRATGTTNRGRQSVCTVGRSFSRREHQKQAQTLRGGGARRRTPSTETGRWSTDSVDVNALSSIDIPNVAFDQRLKSPLCVSSAPLTDTKEGPGLSLTHLHATGMYPVCATPVTTESPVTTPIPGCTPLVRPPP